MRPWWSKPARGEQGQGVAVGLQYTRRGASGGRGGAGVLHTCHHRGDASKAIDLRLIVIDYRVVAAAIRRPPRVVGDGTATVRALIDAQSRRRSAATHGESTIPIDAETERCIGLEGFGLDDILPAGTELQVRETANLHTGGTIHDVTDELHPRLAEAAIAAAGAIEIPVAGIDFIVPSPRSDRYAFIEANERPGLANHEPQPTAERFIDLLFPLRSPRPFAPPASTRSRSVAPMSRLPIDTDYLQDRLWQLPRHSEPHRLHRRHRARMLRRVVRLEVPFELTRRGAIRAVVKGRDHRGARAVIAHLDTLGAQVKAIKDNGRLELVSIGTWSARFAEGARVTVFTDAGTYRGTILPLKASGHTFGDEVDTAPVGWEHIELRIDALARNQRETGRLGIEIGDFVAIDPQPEFLDNGFIVSRHLDDKAGAAVLLAALKAVAEAKPDLPVDAHWLFTIAEEVGIGGASVVHDDVASIVAVDNGTTAPGQNSSEFGVTLAMADRAGPFDYHLTKKLAKLCEEHEIRYQKDIFRHYRSDAAAAEVAGHDVRTALITFGVDASHGYERIHMHALRSLAELAHGLHREPGGHPAR